LISDFSFELFTFCGEKIIQNTIVSSYTLAEWVLSKSIGRAVDGEEG